VSAAIKNTATAASTMNNQITVSGYFSRVRVGPCTPEVTERRGRSRDDTEDATRTLQQAAWLILNGLTKPD
jgi:hypothetical protein